MRTISKEQLRLLEDLSAEGLLGGLPLATAEKDIHVTEALRALSTLKVQHPFFQGRGDPTDTDDGIALVFSGGTCLSKAYGVIPRMSEDVDLRVVLSEPTRPLQPSMGARSRLRALHGAIIDVLTALDFGIPERISDDGNPKVGDGRSYFRLGLAYASTVPKVHALRQELKIEVVHRPPRLATNVCEFGALTDRLSGRNDFQPLRMECMNVGETLAEKVVSFLRRCALYWGPHHLGTEDDALVRHVYDVTRITARHPDAIAVAQGVFADVVRDDVVAFRRRDPDFNRDPLTVMRDALAQLRGRAELRERYERRLLPLVYEPDGPSFDDACAEFEQVAGRLLAAD